MIWISFWYLVPLEDKAVDMAPGMGEWKRGLVLVGARDVFSRKLAVIRVAGKPSSSVQSRGYFWRDP